MATQKGEKIIGIDRGTTNVVSAARFATNGEQWFVEDLGSTNGTYIGSQRVTSPVPVALGKFLAGDEAPWNLLMAAAIVYAIPPLIIYYGIRRKMTGGLTMGGVKG